MIATIVIKPIARDFYFKFNCLKFAINIFDTSEQQLFAWVCSYYPINIIAFHKVVRTTEQILAEIY